MLGIAVEFPTAQITESIDGFLSSYRPRRNAIQEFLFCLDAPHPDFDASVDPNRSKMVRISEFVLSEDTKATKTHQNVLEEIRTKQGSEIGNSSVDSSSYEAKVIEGPGLEKASNVCDTNLWIKKILSPEQKAERRKSQNREAQRRFRAKISCSIKKRLSSYNLICSIQQKLKML